MRLCITHTLSRSTTAGILFDGALSYAGGGKNSRTSQIFIVHNLADQPIGTDSEWEVPFGNVTKGLEYVRAIYPGYGETINQVRIFDEGWSYLDKNFPLVDRVLSCSEFDPVAEAAVAAEIEELEKARLRRKSIRAVVPPWWAVGVAAGLLVMSCARPRRWQALRRTLC
jgi:hypothetical protein